MKSTSQLLMAICVVAALWMLSAPVTAEPIFSHTSHSLDPTPGNGPGPETLVSLTHSASNTITQFNSVSCNAGGLHTDNSYWRSFNLASFGVTGPLDVISIDLGIEQALGAGGSQPATVRYYTDTDANPGNGGLTLIGTVPITVPDASLTVLNFLGGPTGVPASANLVVEVFTPDGQTAGNSFFIGSNNLGQTGPSYLSAPDCGVTAPTSTAAIGFPGMHIVMTVNGNFVPEPTGMGLGSIGLLAASFLRRRMAR